MNSWIGGSLSSLKGQLSHLITEGTEEITDAKDDLMIANEKIQELENKLKFSEKEVIELRTKNNELSVKLESEELMVEEMNTNLKTRIKEKEEIIKSLNNKLSESDLALNSYSPNADNSYESVQFDFGNDDNNIWKQRVNDLENELMELKNSSQTDVHTLILEQRQELEMKHSNYVLQIQEEYQNQISLLKRELANLQDNNVDDYDDMRRKWTNFSSEWVQTEDSNLDIWKDSNDDDNSLDTFKTKFKKEHICGILDAVSKLIIDRNLKTEDIIRFINNYNEDSCPRSPNFSIINTITTGTTANDSLSQVSDVSQMSLRSRVLEDKVQSLSKQLADYERQLGVQLSQKQMQNKYDNKPIKYEGEQRNNNEEGEVGDYDLDCVDGSDRSPIITGKIQSIKLKLAMRKNATIESALNNQDKQDEEDEVTIEDDDDGEEENNAYDEDYGEDDDIQEASPKKTLKPIVKKDSKRKQDLLAHVETFNEEREEQINQLEAKLLSLQNLVEEKEDEIRELREKEQGFLFEYKESIRVLNSELDNVQEELDASREKNTESAKNITKLHKEIEQKDEMIRWLNEEMTMLSTVDDDEDLKDDDLTGSGSSQFKRIRELESLLEEKINIIQKLQQSSSENNDEGKCLECEELEAERNRTLREKNSEIQSLEETIKKYKDYLEENKQLQIKIKEMNTLNHKLEQLNNEKDNKVKLLETQISQLKSKSNRYGNDSDVDDEMLQNIWDLENQLEEKNELIEQFQNTNELIKDQTFQIESLKSDKSKLEEELLHYTNKFNYESVKPQASFDKPGDHHFNTTDDNDDDDVDLVQKVWELENLLEGKTEMIETFQNSERLLSEKEQEIQELIEEKSQLEEQLKYTKTIQEDSVVKSSLQSADESKLEMKIHELERLLDEKNKVIEDLKTINLEQRLKEDEICALTVERPVIQSTSFREDNEDEDELMKRVWELENILEEKNEMIEGFHNTEKMITEKNESIASLLHEKERLQDQLEAFKQNNDEIETLDQSKETIKRLSELIREKDWEIEALKSRNDSLVEIMREQEQKPEKNSAQTTMNFDEESKKKLVEELDWYKTNRDKLIEILNQKHQESLAYHAETERIASLLQEKMSVEKSDQSLQTDLPDSEQQVAASICSEQDIRQIVLLKQEMDKLKKQEEKLMREKKLFQEHLIQIEETYTEEATRAEQRESELRHRIREWEDWKSNNEEKWAREKSGSSELEKERDEALKELAISQTRLQENKVALVNLQNALDSFQKVQNVEASFLRQKQEQELRRITKEKRDLQAKLSELELKLQEQTETVEAAQRLTEHVDRKEDQLAQLQAELSQKEDMIDSLRYDVRKLNSVTESKVDKLLMRNLVIGYFHTPDRKKTEALRVIGSLLQFSDEDYSQIGVDIANKSRWFSWLKSSVGSGGPSNSDSQISSAEAEKKSFAELFVAFLERESVPNNPGSSSVASNIRLPGTEALLQRPAQAPANISNISRGSNDIPINMSAGGISTFNTNINNTSTSHPWFHSSSTSSSTSVMDPHKFFTSSPIVHKRIGGHNELLHFSGTNRTTTHSTSSSDGGGLSPLSTLPSQSIPLPQPPSSSISSTDPSLSVSGINYSRKNPLLSIINDPTLHASSSPSLQPPS